MANEDVPLDEENGRLVAEAVSATSEVARDLVREHETEHGEVLPTLLLDAIGEWFTTSSGTATEADAARAVATINDLYERGNDDVQTIVVTGFLEAMPHPGDAGREVVDRLPKSLLAALRRIEG